jgi:hypothetical protein
MSEVKVNKISPRTNCGTVQLGDSGDTITIPAGASITNSGTASGFGATGAVSWNTTVKTSGFTAVAGEGYFVNTTGGAISVNLPAGTAGAVVGFKDYANTFDTNAVTLVQNGSDKIGGSTVNATLGTEGLAVTLVFIDSTQGWLVTDNGTQDTAPTAQYVTATGGTITTSGDFKIHTFTGPGTFCVSCAGNPAGSTTVSYAVVAGAGGGGGSALGYYSGGGGGAGGFREGRTTTCSYTVSPLNAPAGLPVSATGYPITVGGGGSGGGGSCGPNPPSCRSPGNPGSNSVFSTITSARGGAGGESGANPGQTPNGGCAGGSGGGGGGYNSNGDGGLGAGNSPPVSPPQGQPGGAGSIPGGGQGGAGGGATTAGAGPSHNAAGGAGATTCISASPVTYGVGGNSGADCNSLADSGTANRGNGGQGGNNFGPNAGGGAGGSGIVIIRYKFQ